MFDVDTMQVKLFCEGFDDGFTGFHILAGALSLFCLLFVIQH